MPFVRVNVWGNRKKKIQLFADIAGKKISEVSTAAARRIAVNLAFHTEPFGFDDEARQKGEEAIHKDIRKVYAIASDVFGEIAAQNLPQAKAFYHYMESGQYERAAGILRSVGSHFAELPIGEVNPLLHQGARGFGGRVHTPDFLELAKKANDVAAYVATIQPRTGYAASGWAGCAAQLGGTRGIPEWKKGNHGLPYETSKVSNNSSNQWGRIIMTNLVPYASSACPERNVRRALEREDQILTEMIHRAIEAAANEAGET